MMSKKKTGLDNVRRQRISDRVLILTLFVQILILVNQSIGIYAVAAQSMQASIMEPEGEALEIHIETDTGRLNLVEKLLRRASDWLSSIYVDGVERTQATTGITITVTGSSVVSTAIVDYYIEAVPQSGGTPYRFLKGNNTAITVGGSTLNPTNQTTIENHLTAMGLSTSESHIVDYYVYVRAEATGAVSGEPLTSEILYTKFDTVTYTFDDPGTWSSGTWMQSDGYAGRVEHVSQSYNDAAMSTGRIMMGRRSDGYNYGSYLAFEMGDQSNPPPVGSNIREAYIQLSAETPFTARTVTVSAYEGLYWSSSYIDNYAEWTAVYGYQTDESVSWTIPGMSQYGHANTSDISPIMQELVDTAGYSANSRTTFFFDATASAGTYAPEFYCWLMNYKPILYIRWSTYSASWYPLPPMSLASLPITLDVVAMVALIMATLYALHERRRGKR